MADDYFDLLNMKVPDGRVPITAPNIQDGALVEPPPPPPPPGIMSRVWSSLANIPHEILHPTPATEGNVPGVAPGSAGRQLATGFVGGVNDVFAKPSTWLLDRGADLGVISRETADQARAATDQHRQETEEAAKDHPLVTAGRIAGQTLATAPILSGAGGVVGSVVPRLAPGLAPVVDFLGGEAAAAPGANLATRALVRGGSLASQGALQGGATGALTAAPDESTPEAAVRGALTGALVAPVVRALSVPVEAAAGTLMGPVSPQAAALGAKALREGIDVGPAQLTTNPSYKIAADQMAKMPFSGAARDFQTRALQWQKAVASEFGETDVPNGITSAVMGRAAKRIGQGMDAIEGRTVIGAGPNGELYQDLGQIGRDMPSYGLSGDQTRQVGQQVRNVLDAFRQGGGQITGKAFKNLTETGSPLDTALNSQDPTIVAFANRVKDSLNKAFQRSAAPDDATAYRALQQQYRTMKTVEPLVEQKGAMGNLDPARLLSEARKQSARFDPSTGGIAYTGGGRLGDLAYIGNTFLGGQPESGTAMRSIIAASALGSGPVLSALGANPATAALPVAGLVANRLGSAWLRNPEVARVMMQRALTPGAQTRALGPLGVPATVGLLGELQ